MSRRLLAPLALVLLLAPAAWGASPETGASEVEAWRGRYCTPLGCRGAPRAPAASAAGFGAAAFAALALARRKRSG